MKKLLILIFLSCFSFYSFAESHFKVLHSSIKPFPVGYVGSISDFRNTASSSGCVTTSSSGSMKLNGNASLAGNRINGNLTYYSGSTCNTWKKSGSWTVIVEGYEPDTFCSSSEFLEISASESNACAAQYPDFLTDFSSTCNSRDDYSFTCNQGVEKPPVTDPDPTDPDPTDPDPTDPDPTDPDPTDPDPTDPDPTDPDPTDPDPTPNPDPTDPDPTPNPDPTYNNGGNAHGSGSSGGSASASDGNVSVDISFDGVHNRLDAVNDNLAGTNERIETTNDLLNDFSNRYNQNSKKNLEAISGVGSDLGKKLDANGKLLTDAVGVLGDKLDDISDGSNTSASDSSCEVGGFSCDGNSYECYIARTSWKNNCLIHSLTGSDLVPIEGVPADVSQQVLIEGDALISELAKYKNDNLDPDKLSNGDVLITDSLDKFNESNGLSFDEKCPAPNVVDTGMGVFTIDYTPFCDLALYVRAMLMLFASIGSILMISKFS